ncbi:MAG TPA: galactose oxidase early set domain-containing protein, partial [Nevskiaceae bacterium]|nr:galactose oxidase early set domain-containing protein [Nevskiaceae bacterium]
PPYLFKKDGSGQFAPRPQITSAPQNALGWNKPFSIDVSAGTQVSRVTFVRMSTVTHSYDSESRFFELPHTQSGNTVSLKTPGNRADAPPGYYLVFAFDASGVPSVGRIVRML